MNYIHEATGAVQNVAAIREVHPTPTGFQIKTTVADLNSSGVNYMYVAFR